MRWLKHLPYTIANWFLAGERLKGKNGEPLMYDGLERRRLRRVFWPPNWFGNIYHVGCYPYILHPKGRENTSVGLLRHEKQHIDEQEEQGWVWLLEYAWGLISGPFKQLYPVKYNYGNQKRNWFIAIYMSVPAEVRARKVQFQEMGWDKDQYNDEHA